jgi:hypothetical protein
MSKTRGDAQKLLRVFRVEVKYIPRTITENDFNYRRRIKTWPLPLFHDGMREIEYNPIMIIVRIEVPIQICHNCDRARKKKFYISHGILVC